jgi:hypothetical protein
MIKIIGIVSAIIEKGGQQKSHPETTRRIKEMNHLYCLFIVPDYIKGEKF